MGAPHFTSKVVGENTQGTCPEEEARAGAQIGVRGCLKGGSSFWVAEMSTKEDAWYQMF